MVRKTLLTFSNKNNNKLKLRLDADHLPYPHFSGGKTLEQVGGRYTSPPKKVVNKKGNWSRGREARKGITIKLKVMGEVFRESAQLGLSKTPVRGNPFQKKGNHCCNDTELIE